MIPSKYKAIKDKSPKVTTGLALTEETVDQLTQWSQWLGCSKSWLAEELLKIGMTNLGKDSKFEQRINDKIKREFSQ